jgi:hypothetical protein
VNGKRKTREDHIRKIDAVLVAVRSVMIKQIVEGRSGSVSIKADFLNGGVRNIESVFSGSISEILIGIEGE